MKLFYSPTSPFARKVLVCATEHELLNGLKLVQLHPLQDAEAVAAVTPLGKVPALQTETGRLIVDSPLICEYLDRQAVSSGGQSFIPSTTHTPELADDDARVHALADGLMDAAYLHVMESNRQPEQQSPLWKDRWRNAIHRTLTFLETEYTNERLPSNLTMGGIALGCALGYLDFRLADMNWRDTHPALIDFYRPLSERKSFIDSTPSS
ncbi:glutathione S-transferase N-terminal domain-containing protein [Marinobacter lipolyticus]|uniref:glutathione S-transferase N-terminal domain-containing protein n=1 Tax=Marinobacter lipolyticus TaxID=209639 RepID=UPI003A94AFF6